MQRAANKSNARLIIVALVSNILGCTNEYKYEYISLDRSMDIVAYGMPNVSGIHDHSEMPVQYSLARKDYLIDAMIDATAQLPTVIFDAKDQDGREILIDATGVECFLYQSPIRPHEPKLFGISELSVRFKWDAKQPPPCMNKPDPSETARVIILRLFNEQGEKLGEEHIFFDIIVNGSQTIRDSL